MKQNLPIFRVGQYVRLRPSVAQRHGANLIAAPVGWRQLTQEERDAWYEEHYKAVKEGRELPYDSAGESVLSPQDTYIDVYFDRVYEIVRGRVSAARGYGKQPGCCLVRCLLLGEEFYMRRQDLALA